MRTKLIIAAIALPALSGCGGDATNEAMCRHSVAEEMKATEVQNAPNHKYKYIVRMPDGSIWWAETMDGYESKVTAKTLLFPAK